VIDRVAVCVNKVDDSEINQLNTLIKAIQDDSYYEIIKQAHLSKDYVVVVEPATSSRIKEVLTLVLKCVEAKRIEIKT
jgi:hypothetical protein